MTKIEGSNYTKNIKNSLFHTLLRRIPPKSYSPHLEDIVNVLMDALSKGEIEIDLSKDIPTSQLNCQGWPKAHKKALLASGWLEGKTAPMVLKKNQLYWRRWHDEMEEVVEELIHRSTIKLTRSKGITKQEGLNLQRTLNVDQRNAVEVVLNQRVILLSGGPGTGKTSTIMQMIERALFIKPNLRIGLASPTGKATRRLQESLQKGIKAVGPSHQEELCKIPCNTLHRWLEARSHGFGRNKNNPLNLDLLVVDEMSMVDMVLMRALLEALSQSTQLILVGDHNQLPPISSGAIWHQLQNEKTRVRFGEGAIHLHKCYRNRGELASLSRILCDQGIHSFWENLSQIPKTANVQAHQCNSSSIPLLILKRLENHSKRLEHLTKSVLESIPKEVQLLWNEDINLGEEGVQLQNCLEELMLLCPKRYGDWGVDEIHKACLGNRFKEDISSWPQGTPVMCSENQPELNLANGDIGIIIGDNEERRLIFRVFSEEQEQKTRFIHPARLKVIEPALAMTIHKAQGSEADEVVLLWTEECSESSLRIKKVFDNKSYEERLLYTAITRARKKVDLIIKSTK